MSFINDQEARRAIATCGYLLERKYEIEGLVRQQKESHEMIKQLLKEREELLKEREELLKEREELLKKPNRKIDKKIKQINEKTSNLTNEINRYIEYLKKINEQIEKINEQIETNKFVDDENKQKLNQAINYFYPDKRRVLPNRCSYLPPNFFK